MTTGALIFAFDNEATDYVAMAAWSAQRIRRWLKIPVAVVTDAVERAEACAAFDRVIPAQAQTGGKRWFEDYQESVSWHNAGRVDAYTLTPWNQTLVMDADYVVNSPLLATAFDYDLDFLCFRDAYNLTNPDQPFLSMFGRHNFPMHWATVMLFRKSTSVAWIFESMQMIRQNWQHYRDLYGIAETNYRNDYALSIALSLVNGHNPRVSSFAWRMASVLPSDKLQLLDDQDPEQYFWEIAYTNTENKLKKFGFVGMDFHAMGKRDLGDIVAGRTRLSSISSQH